VKVIRHLFDRVEKHFQKGGKLESLYYLYEVFESFFFVSKKTKSAPHVRDGIDLKRVMITVVIATLPAVFMAMYNTGLQANRVLAQAGLEAATTWQAHVIARLGIGFDPHSFWAALAHGALYFLPVYIVTFLVGIAWEVLFACVRKHEINEGFFVTSMLFALIMPPNIPLWQVALGISFGVVLGKEVFGGVGMNILNPALVGRAFLFFAYPAQVSGDRVWVAIDAMSKATPLARLAESSMGAGVSWIDSFLGLIPGSMGETSTLACLIGAAILIITGLGSWRIMLSVFAGMVATSLLFNVIGSDTNPMFQLSPLWHLTLGGFAFGTVFMATDPVSAAITRKGKYYYGFLIGFLVVMIRVVNPAFPEGMMLAILFSNVFAPIIDRMVINANIKRRLAKHVQ